MTKNTILLVLNKIPVYKVRAFNYYRVRKKNLSKVGYFTYNSIRRVTFNEKMLLKRRVKIKGLITGSRQLISRLDLSYRFFFNNNIVLLRKNFNVVTTRILGLGVLEIRRKKYLNNFLAIF